MIKWHREGRFPINKLVEYFKVSHIHTFCRIPTLFFTKSHAETSVLMNSSYQVDDFEEALTKMKSGEVIKPVLVW